MEAIESGLYCACHSSLLLEEKFEYRKGLVTNMLQPCLVSDPYSPEAPPVNNASIVGTRLAGCGLHVACIGMVPPFTCIMWTNHKFTACAQAFFKQNQLGCIKTKRPLRYRRGSTKLERR